MEIAIIGGLDTTELRAEIAAQLHQRYLDHIMLNGDGPGVHIHGIFSVDDVKAIDRLSEASRRVSVEIKELSQQIEALGRRKSPECKPLKPYRQRGFYTQPGSRQDKYSRSKR